VRFVRARFLRGDKADLSSICLLVDIKYIAVHHFVELTYNGIVRRLLVSLARAAPSFPASTPPAPPAQAFTISRSTIVTFKPPIAPSSETHARGAASLGRVCDADEGRRPPGYESIGGMESQIEQIRELVEWPLTRPELYQHFGKK